VNTHLYAQTGHFTTPKEAAIFMLLLLGLVIIGVIRRAVS
jgi:hypothetical protein